MIYSKSLFAAAVLGLMGVSCSGLNERPTEISRRADPEARPGGKLVVGLSRPASIDPGNAADPAGALIASLVCEPLIQLDPASGKLAHGIVESLVVGEMGTLFTLRIRKGVKFHNGETVAAHDVAYAISRVARHDFASSRAHLLESIVGYESVHAPPRPTKTDNPATRTLSGVRVISRNALDVQLQEPNADFIRALATPLAAPVPRGFPDRDPGFARQPVCAGPYKMTRPYRLGDSVIELRQFRGYYGRNDAFTRGGAGYPEVIEFRIEPDRAAELNDFKAGVLDVAHVPPDALEQARGLGAQFMTTPVPSVDFVGLPISQPPFDDPRIRRLLSAAIDRDRLVDEVFGGGRLPADGFLPPLFNRSQINKQCAENVPPEGRTLASDSREVVLDAAAGQKYQFKVNEDFRNTALAQAVADQWHDKLGFDFQVQAMSWDAYLAEATGPTGIVDAAFRESWSADYPSIDALLNPLFHSREIGHNNFSRFDSRAFDRRIERIARREQDEDLRLAKYLSLEEILCRDIPLIPIAFGQEEYLVRVERVGAAAGQFFDRFSGSPLLREVYLRQE